MTNSLNYQFNNFPFFKENISQVFDLFDVEHVIESLNIGLLSSGASNRRLWKQIFGVQNFVFIIR